MNVELVDIGVNLTDHAFAKDLDDVIAQAAEVGVNALLVTGTNLKESRQAIQLSHQYAAALWCTAGVHPHHAKEWTPDHFETLRQLSDDPKVIAIGETGLDFNRNFSPPDQQLFAFEEQLKLAADTGLPLFLHERDAHEAQFSLLKKYRDSVSGGVIHCFTGSKEELENYLALDLYVGITGWICDERRGLHLQELVKLIPRDRLLLETDSPYLMPRSLRPKPKSRRNEPRYLPHINEQIAMLLGIDATELAAQTTSNARQLFTLK